MALGKLIDKQVEYKVSWKNIDSEITFNCPIQYSY